MSARAILVALLSLAVLSTALGVVYSKHETRRLFIGVQRLEAERDRMNFDWVRLQLEQSTQATQARIESIAHGKLAMNIPPQDSVVIVGR
ncbi:MAG: cell division protein FtsL [Gammaproteobacteria bacterium]|nr:cell division protein FtsL [Gammaproteobacteria bacterium]